MSTAANRRVAPSAAVVSPCVSICEMEPRTGLCRGCFRTLDEIAAWSVLGDDARRAVMAALPARRERAGTTR
ncbi:MAG TPA: DUF1289 domain-containing protein [Casimicrobiaceae bacterium]|nr:DUF1289 domain-containing protein [Casimicrobiaceae bacterium]